MHAMTRIRRSIILLLPAAQTALLALALHFESWFGWLLLAAFVLTDACLTLMTPKGTGRAQIFFVSLPPVGLIAGSFGMLFIVENALLKNTVIGFNAILQMIYLLNMYYHFYRSHYYQERSLLHINGVFQTVVFFYLAGILFGLHYFLDIPLWYLLPPFLAASLIFFAQYALLHAMGKRQLFLLLTAWALILVESVFVLQYLPTIYYVNAFVLTAAYYAFSNLSISAVVNEISRRQIVTYMVLCGGMGGVALCTALWNSL